MESFEQSSQWTQMRACVQAATKKGLLFATGAGISLASGIPTFRGSDIEAVWKKSPVELGTLAYFEENPVGHWAWFLDRLDKYSDAQPNPAHHAITALERWQEKRGGSSWVITQNVDLLHDRAGTKNLIHIHGDMGHVRCSQQGCKYGAPFGKIKREEVDFDPFRRSNVEASLPRCPACHALLRIHALLFDEYYTSHKDYRINEAMAASVDAGVMIFVGTSFSVGITASMLEIARTSKIPVFSINPVPETAPLFGFTIQNIQARSEEALPLLCAELGIPLP